MEKVTISLWKGKNRRLVGLNIYEDEGIEEVRQVIRITQESLERHFPDAEIIRARAGREMFGE